VKKLRLLSIGAAGAVISVSSMLAAPSAFADPVPTGGTACTPQAGYANCLVFTATGSDHTFSVPANVTSVLVKLWGAGGGGVEPSPSDRVAGGGSGGFTTGTLAVTPNSALTLVVGQGGAAGGDTATYGGGGAGGTGGEDPAGSGGGLSGVYADSAGTTPLLVAGGGGGAGGANSNELDNPTNYAGGGGGGGLSGTDVSGDHYGSPGTQASGGAAAVVEADPNCATTPATNGAHFFGGTGQTTLSANEGTAGGGGGGGYFGGGGGACTDRTNATATSTFGGSGGGGGSAYIGGAGVTNASTIAGTAPTTIFIPADAPGAADPLYNPGVGEGGSTDFGGSGEVVVEWNVAPAAPAASVTAPAVMKVVTQAQTFPVTCKLSVRTIGSCGVTLVYRNSRGSYVIGTGSVTRSTGSAAGQLVTRVTLNATGHYLAAIAPIPTWVYASITPYGSRSVLPATARTVVENYNLK
jgi:hypothetical protein